MPKANANHTPSRRNFLGHLAGGAAVVAVAAGTARVAQAVQADNPAAELIALCAEFDALERSKQTLYADYYANDEDPPEHLSNSLHDRQGELLDLITVTRATTGPGFVALAHTIVLWARDLVEKGCGEGLRDRNHGYWNDRMVAMLLGDMTANSVAGGAA